MSNYDAIVVGGGINGLVAGAVLGRKGKKVCIIEKLDSFGGMASYAVDGGRHWHMRSTISAHAP